MSRGYVGSNASAFVETTYEYAGSELYNAEEFVDFLSYNLQMATDTKTYQKYMPNIGKLAVQFARDFVVQNGTYKTGRLYDSINWAPTSTGITLFANARDEYGSAYAGHIEYGFVGRDGLPHGPWPFLRPAMRLAAEASQGILAQAAAKNILYGNRYGSELSFGRAGVRHLLGNQGRSERFRYTSSTRNAFKPNTNNQGRWTRAQHGIDHMGGLKNDKTVLGQETYESFKSTFGSAMDSYDFRWGEL